jgi:Co/Zn/Cd efflux system component
MGGTCRQCGDVCGGSRVRNACRIGFIALDFLGDAANYAISLSVAGMALARRARAAWIKGLSLFTLALWVLMSTLWKVWHATLPEPITMGVVGMLACCANVSVAALLFRHRQGDANRRSVWICSRNDAIGNLAVVAAAAGVFGTHSAWPDVIVAAIIALLGLSGGWHIMRQARAELREPAAAAIHAAAVP